VGDASAHEGEIVGWEGTDVEAVDGRGWKGEGPDYNLDLEREAGKGVELGSHFGSEDSELGVRDRSCGKR
jgi:hypothetical protein